MPLVISVSVKEISITVVTSYCEKQLVSSPFGTIISCQLFDKASHFLTRLRRHVAIE